MSEGNGSSADRCLVYCRVSDPGQSTVPEQERWGRELAQAQGWPVAAVVIDEGLSGDDPNRPGLADLEKAFADNLAAGCPVNRLLVRHTNRFSRGDSLDAFETYARLRRLGLRYVVTQGHTIDLRDRLNRTMLSLEQDHTNNPFLIDNARATLGGMAAVAEDGFWVGRVPLGYRLVRTPGEHGAGKRRRSGRLAIDPETGPVVRELFERYAAGESTTDLAPWLTARAKPPSAPRWSAQTVRQLLQSELYGGTRFFGRRARGKRVRLGPSAPVEQAPDQGQDNLAAAMVLNVPALAIVDPALFRRVQERLKGGRRRGHHKAAQPLPLSGLGRCGACGGPLHAVLAWATQRSGRRNKVRRVICANRHRYGAQACPDGSTGAAHDPVLVAVLALLAETLLKDGAAERLALLAEGRAAEAARQREADRAALLRRLADLDATLARSQVRLLDVPEDLREDFMAGLRQVKQQRADVAADLERSRPAPDGADDGKAADRFRRFWDACREAHALSLQGPPYPPALRLLLAEVIEGFTLHWTKDFRGRSTPKRVEVRLPRWVTLLAWSASPPDKQCDLSIVLTRDL